MLKELRKVYPRGDWRFTYGANVFNPLVWGSILKWDQPATPKRRVRFDRPDYPAQDWIQTPVAQYHTPALYQLEQRLRTTKRLGRFDRPDYPPQDWIAAELAAIASRYPAVEQLWKSYRNIKRQSISLSTGVGGQGGSRTEDYPHWMAAIHSQTRSFRLPPRRARFDRPDHPFTSQWFPAIPFVEPVESVAPTQNLLQQFRLPPKRGRFIRPEYPSTDWTTENAAVTDLYTEDKWPALQQLLPTYRAPGRRYYTSEWLGTEWSTPEAEAFDISFFPAFDQLRHSTRRFVLQQLTLNRGVYGGRGGEQAPVAIDDSILSGIFQLLHSFRVDDPRRSLLYDITYKSHAAIDDEGFIYTPSKYPAMSQLLATYRAGRERFRRRHFLYTTLFHRSHEQAVVIPQRAPGLAQLLTSYRSVDKRLWRPQLDEIPGWLFTGTVPPTPFDASLWPAIDQLLRVIELRDRFPRPWISDPDLAWQFTNPVGFDAALYVSIADQLRAFRAQQRLGRDLRTLYKADDLAWLFTNLPGFDETLVTPSYYQFAQYRSADRDLSPWISDPDYAFIFQNLPGFDASLTVAQQAQLEQFRMAARELEPWLSDPDYAWLTLIGGIPIDPALWPAIDQLVQSYGMDPRAAFDLTTHWTPDPFSWFFPAADLVVTPGTPSTPHLRRSVIAPLRVYRRRLVSRRKRFDL